MRFTRIVCEPVGPGPLTPCWIWVLIVIFVFIQSINRCCYSCDTDLGCPACPDGYPCLYPCNKQC